MSSRLPFPHSNCRAFSILSLKAVEDPQTGKRTLIGTATTPTPDRMDDVVVPQGAVYRLPIPLLAHHNSREPIGDLHVTEISDAGIQIEAQMPSAAEIRAAGGVLDYVERAWQQVKLKLVKGLSIGFVPLDFEPIKGTYGYLIKKWEWLELSIVTIPAQPEATIDAIKAAVRSDLAALGTTGLERSRVLPSRAAPRATPSTTRSTKMVSIAERITAKEAEINALRDQATGITAGFGDRDPTEEEGASLDELNRQIDGATQSLSALRAAEKATAPRVLAPPSKGNDIIVPGRRPLQRANKADLVFKGACVFLIAHAQKRTLVDVLKERYPTDDEVATLVKAAVNPADTVTPGWAQELVGQQVAELIDVLSGVSVYGELAQMSLRVTFDRNGLIKVPARNKTPNLAGVFIAEGQPIPVKKGSLSSVTLSPHKAAVISTFTRELAQLSNPSIEAVIREGIIDDTGVQIDANLLDAVAASAARPAGLLNGVVTIPSSGITAANIATDMRALLDAITAAGGGRKLVLILNPARVVGLSTVMNATGQFVFRDEIANGTLFGAQVISSINVPADLVMMVDVADFVTATGDAPEWNVSDVATIHEDDTTPLPLATGTSGAGAITAAPVRSLWQTASIGIRMIWPLTWAMRRANMVAALSGVAW